MSPSVTVQTSGLSAQEIADRKAIQEAWVRYWDVTLALVRTPKAKRKDLLSTVAVEPLVTTVLRRNAAFDAEHIDNYGSVGHNFYWGPPVANKTEAIVGDCMDTSHVGTLSTKTGEKITVGMINDNMRVSVVKGSDGSWKIIGFYSLKGKKC